MLGLTKPSPMSSTPPPAGSTGTTTAGSTAPSEWSRPPNTSKPTTLPSTRRSSPHENGTKAVTLHIACWRAGQPYLLRDVDGTTVTIDQARAIIAERYLIPKDLRARRRTTTATGTDRRSKESPSAPSTGPPNHNATTPDAA